MPDFQHELDARNLSCPMPVMKTKKALKGLASGEVIHVIATDPASADDLSTLVESTGDEIIEQSDSDGEYHFYIKKA